VCVLVEASEATVEDSAPVPLQIYDVPYEGSGDGDKTAVMRPELPWEWKKEHIVKTLSGTANVFYTTSILIADTQLSEKESLLLPLLDS